MAGLLTELRSKRSGGAGDSESTSSLHAINTKTTRKADAIAAESEDINNISVPAEKASNLQSVAASPQEALSRLRSQPDTEVLIHTAKQILSPNGFAEAFSLSTPGPLQAQIINTLLNVALPTFWAASEKRDKALLSRCFFNIAGMNAVVAKIRTVSNERDGNIEICDLLEVADHLFSGDDVLSRLWRDLHVGQSDDTTRQLAWKDLCTLLGSGKIVSIVAQAEDVSKSQGLGKGLKQSWLSIGSHYAEWLGRNIATTISLSSKDGAQDALPDISLLVARSINLGYPRPLLRGLYSVLMRSGQKSDGDLVRNFLNALSSHIKRKIMEQTLTWMSDMLSEGLDADCEISKQSEVHVATAAALVFNFISGDDFVFSSLCNSLSNPSFNASLSLPIRRSCIAAIVANNSDELEPLLNKIMITFGDQLFIDHATISNQESIAQTLLLIAGNLYQKEPLAVLMSARSSYHLQGVSKRLNASSQRARWLGMAVATAFSSLVDKEGTKMNFDVEEMRTAEAKRYFDLVKLQDRVGALDGFGHLLEESNLARLPAQKSSQRSRREMTAMLNGRPVFGPPKPPSLIEAAHTEVNGEKLLEILDDSENEDDRLKPYAKPDSDPEDSDEDATLVNRRKTRPPVYIRDLIRMLKDDKEPKIFELAITHAPSLIRRKSKFGNEVKEHSEELLRIFCHLQDHFDTENFEELRLQSIIALLLSDVDVLGPWLSRQAFAGDYSLAQRCIILSALGLGGRELGGYKNEDELNPEISETDFPTKRLPPRLHAIYAPATRSVNHLEGVFRSSERRLIKPMAIEAADKSTAHLNPVKIRTFSSRMEVERTKRQAPENRLAKIFGTAFFSPLVGRFQQEMATYGAGSIYISSSFLLATFLKTLALLFHASGAATIALPQITADFWELVLSLRVHAAADLIVLEALLFSLLTLLEVNSNRQCIAEEYPKQLMETQKWVELIFDRLGGSTLVKNGIGEEGRVHALAAGVLLKTRELVSAYQIQLFGRVIE
ncbi:MAG: hypothetical protein FE78DRAFT_155358 [Acidomyces sp. 'richmondensis']|nr:MAG: hypothetical protein FE78DRAFT_155358 [Acidomyces sp. 'richmondensis']